jgi:hypothetical protein
MCNAPTLFRQTNICISTTYEWGLSVVEFYSNLKDCDIKNALIKSHFMRKV